MKKQAGHQLPAQQSGLFVTVPGPELVFKRPDVYRSGTRETPLVEGGGEPVARRRVDGKAPRHQGVGGHRTAIGRQHRVDDAGQVQVLGVVAFQDRSGRPRAVGRTAGGTDQVAAGDGRTVAVQVAAPDVGAGRVVADEEAVVEFGEARKHAAAARVGLLICHCGTRGRSQWGQIPAPGSWSRR